MIFIDYNDIENILPFGVVNFFDFFVECFFFFHNHDFVDEDFKKRQHHDL